MYPHLGKFLLVFVAFFCFELGAKAQPVVVGHPSDKAICVDASTSFRVIAVNTAAYQWQENDGVGWYNITAAIGYGTGFNTPLLTISDANLGLNGYLYRCVVFDAEGLQDVSNAALLGVYEPPIITASPTDTKVCKNETAVFAVQSLNATHYKWQENIGEGWVNITDNAFYQGTDSDLLEVFTTTGMNGFRFRCIVTNVSCPDTTDGSFLFVDPTPIIQQITGGGSFCSGGNGVEIGLADSETGISYQLLRNDNPTGIVIEGNNEPVSFGLFTQEGVYTVLAINGFTSCSILMYGDVEVSISLLPAQQQLLGGGAYCPGEPAPEIYLAGTETGVKYQLFLNGAFTGTEILGTGFVSSFGRFADPGLYTVLAINTNTTCSLQLTNQLQLTQHPKPVVFAGSNQFVSRGEIANLSASATGGSGNYSYSWRPQAYVQQPDIASTQTIPLFQSRQFLVSATDLQSGCETSSDTLAVFVEDGPLELELVASQTQICPSEPVQLVALAGGGSGNYSFQWTSLPPGFTSTASEVMVHPEVSTTYKVTLTDGLESLQKSVSIQVNPIAAVFSLTGEGSFCAGDEGATIGLNGSENGVIYQLYNNAEPIAQKAGTGQAISFGKFLSAGTYTASASFSQNSCSRDMQGAIQLNPLPLPVVVAGPNQYIETGTQTTLTAAANGGSGTYQFNWTPLDKLLNPNQANPATLELFETTLFEVVATDAQTGCISEAAQTVVFITGGDLSLRVQASSYSICPGETVRLQGLPSGGSGSYEFQWQSVPPGFSANVANPIVQPTASTKFLLTVTDGFMVITDSLEIEVRSRPQAFILTGGGSYCAGSMAKDIVLEGSENTVFYKLLRNGESTGLLRIGNEQPIVFGQQNLEGIYQVEAFSQQYLCGSLMAGNVEVSQLDVPEIFAGYDRTIQSGTFTNLNAQASGGSGNYSFSWSPAEKVTNPQAQQTLTTPLFQNTIFILDAVDNQTNCQAQADQVQLFVQGGDLTVDATASPTEICVGESVSLNAIVSGGTASYYYSWTSSPAGFYAGDMQTVATPTVSTWYYLRVYDGQETATDSVFVQVTEVPTTFIVSGGGVVCGAGQMKPVNLSGSQAGIKYQLFHDNSLIVEIFGNRQPLQFGNFNQPGIYSVMAVSTNNVCTSAMSGEAIIEQGIVPLANAGPDKWVEMSGQLTLEGSVSGNQNAQFTWNPAAKLLNPDALQPTTIVLDQTTLYSLEASSPGCGSSKDYATVFVTGGELRLDIYASPAACPGSEISLFALPGGGTGNYSYQWSSIPPGFESTIINPLVYPEEPSWYILELSDGLQSIRDSVLIEPLPQPAVFEISGGGGFCAGTEIPELMLSGSEAEVVYTLYYNGLETAISLIGTGFELSFEMNLGAGNYQVFATIPGSSCSRQMNGTASLIWNAIPEVFAGFDQHIETGQTAPLVGNAIGGSGNYTYSWFPDWQVESPNQANTQTTALDQTTVFYFSVTDTESLCVSQQDTLVVFVSGGILTARIASDQNNLCSGQKFVALALPGGGTGNYTYLWTNEAGELLGEANELSVLIFESSWIYLEVSDGEAVATDSTYVTIADDLQQFSVNGGGSYCPGSEPPSIGLSGSETGVHYNLVRNSQIVLTVVGQGDVINFGQFAASGTYTVEAFRPAFPCEKMMTASAVVVAHGLPVISAGADQYILKGTSTAVQALVSGGSGDYSYQWQPAILLNTPEMQASNTVVLQQSAVFEVELTDNQTLCTATDAVNVFVTGGILTVEVLADNAFVCPGQPVKISALPSGGTGDYSWSWTANGQPVGNGLMRFTANPVTDTWFVATIISGEQIAKDSVFVRIHSLPNIYALDGGGSYCENQVPPEVFLNDSDPGATYKLLVNGLYTGLSKDGTGSAVSFGSQYAQGNFHSIAVNEQQCKQLMNGLVEVKQLNPPRIFQLYGGGRWCDNAQGNGVYLSGSQANVDYTLSLNGETALQTIAGNGSAMAFNISNQSGVYTVEATPVNSICSRQMRGFVSTIIDPSPQLMLSGNQTACENDFFSLSASGASQYQWLLDTVVTTSDVDIPAVEDLSFLLIGSNSLGCSDSLQINLTVNPKPEIELIVDADLKLVRVEPNEFQQYDFLSGNIILQTGSSNQLIYEGLTLVNDSILVKAITGENCISQAKAYIEPLNEYNAFSPNGDGINDIFRKGDFIRVFSRWGVEIFSGDQGWDGRYKETMVAPGTYYYLHEIRNSAGELLRTEKGAVTLVIE